MPSHRLSVLLNSRVESLALLPSDAAHKVEGVEAPSGHRYMYRTLLCLEPTDTVRLCFVGLVENAWFERVSLIAVLLNCIVLALQGPPVQSAVQSAVTGHHVENNSPDGWLSSEIFEVAFTIFFTVELTIRWSAYATSGTILPRH